MSSQSSCRPHAVGPPIHYHTYEQGVCTSHSVSHHDSPSNSSQTTPRRTSLSSSPRPTCSMRRRMGSHRRLQGESHLRGSRSSCSFVFRIHISFIISGVFQDGLRTRLRHQAGRAGSGGAYLSENYYPATLAANPTKVRS